MQLPGRIGRAQSVPHRAWAVVLAALGIAVLVWVLQTPADAQGALQSAQPGPSAHLERAPERVNLHFGQPPAPGSRTKLVVLSPTDENLARGPVSSSALGLSQRLAPPREPGAYQVSYEVVAVDGHVTRGRYWFWYAPHQSGSGSAWLGFPSLALLVVAAAVVMALLARRRMRRRMRRAITLVTPEGPRGISATAAASVQAASVPTQRSPHNHEGLSASGSRHPPRSGRVAQPEQSEPHRPHQG